MIYEHVYNSEAHRQYVELRCNTDEGNVMTRRERWQKDSTKSQISTRGPPQKGLPPGIALQRTCRQIHSESWHLLYEPNLFSMRKERAWLWPQGKGPWSLPTLDLLELSPQPFYKHITQLRLNCNVHRKLRTATEKGYDFRERFWPMAIIYCQQVAAVMPSLKSCRFMFDRTDFRSLCYSFSRNPASQIIYERLKIDDTPWSDYKHVASFPAARTMSQSTNSMRHPVYDIFAAVVGDIQYALVEHARDTETELLRVHKLLSIEMLEVEPLEFERQHHLHIYNKCLNILRDVDLADYRKFLENVDTLLDGDDYSFSAPCPRLGEFASCDSSCTTGVPQPRNEPRFSSFRAGSGASRAPPMGHADRISTASKALQTIAQFGVVRSR